MNINQYFKFNNHVKYFSTKYLLCFYLAYQSSWSLTTLHIFLLIDFREKGREVGRRGGEREREREKHQFVVLLTFELIGCFLYVPWQGIEPTALPYPDDTLTLHFESEEKTTYFSPTNLCFWVFLQFWRFQGTSPEEGASPARAAWNDFTWGHTQLMYRVNGTCCARVSRMNLVQQ